MMGHTKEPWETSEWSKTTILGRGAIGSSRRVAVTNVVSTDGNADQDIIAENADNAARIVACVTAFEGIDDPAAFMADLRKLMGETLPSIDEVVEITQRVNVALGLPNS